jgi:3-dehydrotetronate 4-kinase
MDQALSEIVVGLASLGVRRLVAAGGETSGARVKAPDIHTVRVGPQIDPGVPWCHAEPVGLRIALKSGNFGSTDFFDRAFDIP